MSEHDDDSLYRELVEHQQDLLVKFTPDGHLLFVNTAYCHMVGKAREELAGSVFMPATDQRYSEVMAARMTRLFRPPYACQVEQWISSPQGPRCIRLVGTFDYRRKRERDRNCGHRAGYHPAPEGAPVHQETR